MDLKDSIIEEISNLIPENTHCGTILLYIDDGDYTSKFIKSECLKHDPGNKPYHPWFQAYYSIRDDYNISI